MSSVLSAGAWLGGAAALGAGTGAVFQGEDPGFHKDEVKSTTLTTAGMAAFGAAVGFANIMGGGDGFGNSLGKTMLVGAAVYGALGAAYIGAKNVID